MNPRFWPPESSDLPLTQKDTSSSINRSDYLPHLGGRFSTPPHPHALRRVWPLRLSSSAGDAECCCVASWQWYGHAPAAGGVCAGWDSRCPARHNSQRERLRTIEGSLFFFPFFFLPAAQEPLVFILFLQSLRLSSCNFLGFAIHATPPWDCLYT